MALFRVTTLQGKLVIKTQITVLTVLLLPLFNFIPVYIVKIKDGYHTNPAVEKGRNPINTFCVTIRRNKKSGRRLPQTLLDILKQCSTSPVVLSKEKVNTKIISLYRKGFRGK